MPSPRRAQTTWTGTPPPGGRRGRAPVAPGGEVPRPAGLVAGAPRHLGEPLAVAGQDAIEVRVRGRDAAGDETGAPERFERLLEGGGPAQPIEFQGKLSADGRTLVEEPLGAAPPSARASDPDGGDRRRRHP